MDSFLCIVHVYYITDSFLCIVPVYILRMHSCALYHKDTSFQWLLCIPVACHDCNEVIGKMIMITGQSWGGGNLPLIYSLG